MFFSGIPKSCQAFFITSNEYPSRNAFFALIIKPPSVGDLNKTSPSVSVNLMAFGAFFISFKAKLSAPLVPGAVCEKNFLVSRNLNGDAIAKVENAAPSSDLEETEVFCLRAGTFSLIQFR